MGINVRFIGQGAMVKHLNVRKEGPEDDKILAVDVKFNGEVNVGKWLVEMFCPFEDDDMFTPELINLFWYPGEDADVRFRGIKEFKCNREFKNCLVQFGNMELRGDTKKFAFVPLAGKQANLEFSISVSDPDSRTVSLLAEMVDEKSQCELFGADLFDPHPEEETEEDDSLV